MTTITTTVDLDLFSDDVLTDPYPTYRRLRDAGAAVWLPACGCWAVSRYDDVRTALADHETYTSVRGVGLNDGVNQAIAGTVLCSEPPLHNRLRAVLAERLSPSKVRALTPAITTEAERLVDDLVQCERFDAVGDLAQVFTPSIIADLIGVPQDVRNRLLPWGNAVFDAMGPVNSRTIAAMPLIAEQTAWLAGIRTGDLAQGSMGRAIYEAAEAGVIDEASAPPLFWAYTGAGTDTTVSAIGSAICLLAAHPEQFQRLRADPSLVPRALTEVLRLESPIQTFTRVLRAEVTLGGITVPPGQRLIMLYGSANRDERHFGTSAEEFDLTRQAGDHLAFGYGLHGCAGQALARIEAQAILTAIVERVAELRLAGPPVRRLNNALRSFASVPVVVTPA